MIRACLHVVLTCRAPIVTRSSEPSRWGVDIPFARNSDGNAIIPGSQIKGHLSDALTQLAQILTAAIAEESIRAWFGATDEDAGLQERRNIPHRGRLTFSDFVGPSLSGSRELRYRVARDPRTAAAARHALAVVECPWPSGSTVIFKGTIDFVAADQNEVAGILSAVRMGLCWIPQLGSQKSIGFGELIGVEVIQAPAGVPTLPAQGEASADRTRALYLNPEDAFCIAKPRSSENVFDSETSIPGAVIRGCLAESWRHVLGLTPTETVDGVATYVLRHRAEPRCVPWVELASIFDQIVFRHAFPTQSSEPGREPVRAVFPPVSIGYTGERWRDYALDDPPVLMDGMAPAFSPDWKPDVGIWAEFGWAMPKHELRVRTAISPDSGRAKDTALFGYDMINAVGCTWVSEVTLPEGFDNDLLKRAWTQLSTLLVPRFGGLGKTKARVRARTKSGGPDRSITAALSPSETEIVVTLQTAALLANPRQFVAGSGSGEALHSNLRSVWLELSRLLQGTLNLKRFFARQSLAGGPYLWRRFQFGRPYNPWLLTDAGSVFVFERTKEAERCLRSFVECGVPLANWVRENYQPEATTADWRTTAWRWCPFVPESGFGEIAIDLDCQQKPKDGTNLNAGTIQMP